MEAALTKIDPTGALLNDYKNGTGILHVEGIMTTFIIDSNGNRVHDGQLKIDEDGFVNGVKAGTVYGYVGENSIFNGDMYDLMKKYSWDNKAAFYTHYNKILPYTHAKTDEGVIIIDADKVADMVDVPGLGKTGSSGKTEPDVYTWHTDETYDVGEGIPSGESFVNHYKSDKWYGTYEWELMPTASYPTTCFLMKSTR